MADTTPEKPVAINGITMIEDSTLADQACDPQIPASGQKSFLLDLPLELLQDILLRTDMLTTIRLVCRDLRVAVLDAFAEEYVETLACFVYDESRWRRLKAALTSRLWHRIRHITFCSDVMEMEMVHRVPTAPNKQDEQGPLSVTQLEYCTQVFKQCVKDIGCRTPSCALMLSVLREVGKRRSIDVSVEFTASEVPDLDTKRFPVHRDLLFVMATLSFELNSFDFTVYSMHNLRELMEEMPDDMSELLATPNDIRLESRKQKRSELRDPKYSDRVDLAIEFVGASQDLHRLDVDLSDLEHIDGASRRMLMANDFAFLKQLECMSGRFRMNDLPEIIERAWRLQKLQLHGVEVRGLKADWDKFVACLRELQHLDVLLLDDLNDVEERIFFHDPMTGKHSGLACFASRKAVVSGLEILDVKHVCFGGLEMQGTECSSRRQAHVSKISALLWASASA